MSNVETPFYYSISFKLSRIKTPVNLSYTLCNYFLKKEGFFRTFVVLVLRCRKIEKD
jgi:hypothetical protein